MTQKNIMKAVTYRSYGSHEVVRFEDVPVPTVTEGGVLVRVRGASVNPYDWHFMRGEPYFMRLQSGIAAPKRTSLGVDFSGIVEAVGPGVAGFTTGDEVYGMCDGAFAEYLCADPSHIALKPHMLDFDHAAAVPLAGLTALQGLRDAGGVRRGDNLLIIGASGGVGTFAVQLAKHSGCHVAGVCSTRNCDLVRSLGADEVIDYVQQDFASAGRKYDLVFQLGGQDSPLHCRHALTRRGKLIVSSGESHGKWIGPVSRIITALAVSPFVSQTLTTLSVRRSRADLEFLAGLIDDGALKPVIDRRYPLAQAGEAIRYVEQAHSRGKVLVAIE